MKLLDLQGNLTPQDSKTHIRMPFIVEIECTKLYMSLKYGPKTLEDRDRSIALLKESYNLYILPEHREYAIANVDRHLPLKNLITLSLDDTNGYRGACHRHDDIQELYISSEHASPGLMAGVLPAGTWTVTLSVHCIVTEACTYQLQIWATEEDSI
ncbi:hypothetical protein HUB98_01960 [Paenibacillus barcinonensis]|uniref:Uncharacterized protein n=1 Tax=Paenibacillus barcinonensis TaxID=198119 RepID=A0A2V4VH41_PAEBA|nr:hypothetical protein [Paenibacillus barcinonensis]PYE48086.1 hypothetical protein DFQ00_110148 [Paenibacillus barcinonensis]QKS55194.1 hypothetical protein HUB98_01960 [Paenibacillus barcinonensis]